MSNNECISVDHRVLANTSGETRMSVAVFYYLSDCESLFGLFPKLISLEKPAVYQQFKVEEYLKTFYTNELDGKSLKNYFRA